MMLEKEISEQEIEVEKELSVIVDMDYNKATNKPSINDVVLEGNKTLDDLGIAPKKDYIEKSTFDEKIQELNNKDKTLEEKIEETEGKIPDTKDFITKDVEDLTNYTKTTDLERDYASKTDITGFIKKDVNDLDNYTKTTDLEKEYAKKAEIPNVENFITKEVEELDNFTNNTELEKKLKEKADTKDIPDVSNFITKEVNDLTNYTNNTDLEKNYTKKKDIEGVIKNLEDASYDYIHTNSEGYPITVENAGPYNIKKLKIYGNSEQETRSGKNLFNYLDQSYVTGTGVSVDNEGWITISNDNAEKEGNTYGRFYISKNSKLTKDKYNVIVEIKNVTGTGGLQIMKATGTGQLHGTLEATFEELENGKVISAIANNDNLEAAGELMETVGVFTPGQSGSVTFRISVLEDTTITKDNFAYESYGVMPSPDYPSEIKTVEPVEIEEEGYLLKEKITGKNLLNLNFEDYNANGISIKNNHDGTVTFDGSSNVGFRFYLSSELLPLNVGDKITLSYKEISGSVSTPTGSFKLLLYAGDPIGNLSLGNDTVHSAVQTRDIDKALTSQPYIWFGVQSGEPTAIFDNYRIAFQIEMGDTATDFEPYKEKEFSIKMSNEKGQQYELAKINDTKDDLDFISGVLNKRIGKIDSYNNEEINTEYISTTGQLTTGATVYYELETPEQIQLQPINIQLFEGYNRITIEDKNGIVKEAEITYLTPIKDQFATIDYVNNAISTAITGALEEEY